MRFRVKDNFKTISSNDLNQNIKNVKIKDDYIYYDLNKINNKEYIEVYCKNKVVLNFLKKHIIGIFSLIIISILIINFKFCFIKINYNFDNVSKEEIVEMKSEISNYYNSLIIFNYLNADVSDINYNLRSKYYNYEWINIHKKGLILNVNVKAKDNLDVNHDSDTVGDIYASHDGIVYKTFVKRGKLLVQNNFFVRKGDLLVSGNLLYGSKDISYDYYVKAEAFILACVFDIVNIEIKKIESSLKRSGKIEVFKSFSFINKKLNCSFENYETEIIESDSLFKRDKIICYELIESINYYSYDDALLMAKSIIFSEFNEKVVHNDEKIIDIYLNKYTYDEDYYYFNFLLKSYKNIALFKEFDS